MKENTDDKSLVKINKNNMFYKIKQFFKNLFFRNEPVATAIIAEANNIIKHDADKKNLFMEEIKKIEDEGTLLLKLQKKYRSAKIKEEDLTEEQVVSLCKLYDKQIANLKKSNEVTKQKISEYRKRLQTDN